MDFHHNVISRFVDMYTCIYIFNRPPDHSICMFFGASPYVKVALSMHMHICAFYSFFTSHLFSMDTWTNMRMLCVHYCPDTCPFCVASLYLKFSFDLYISLSWSSYTYLYALYMCAHLCAYACIEVLFLSRFKWS